MKASLATIKSLLLNNVAEIKFLRRRPKFGGTATRRMLCTNSLSLLNSTEGDLLLITGAPLICQNLILMQKILL